MAPSGVNYVEHPRLPDVSYVRATPANYFRTSRKSPSYYS